MIRVRPAIRSPYPPRTRVQTRVTKDDIWRALWPYITTNVVAGFLILVLLLIGALETASLAISTEPDVYGYTSSTGSGFWCGFYIFIAAVLIISISKYYDFSFFKNECLIISFRLCMFYPFMVYTRCNCNNYCCLFLWHHYWFRC